MTKDDLLKILEDPRKQVISVDLDGCLCREIAWTPEDMENATPNKRFIQKVNEMHRTGFVVIHTARRSEDYHVTKDWLDRNGVKYHAIVTDKLPATCYIDDSALHMEDL